MKQKIADFLDIDIEDLKELTKEQEKVLRESTSNLWQMPSYYTDSHIIFTSESALKHWQYYAGFEYLDDPETMKRSGEFIAAYCTDSDSDDRIQKYLDIINN